MLVLVVVQQETGSGEILPDLLVKFLEKIKEQCKMLHSFCYQWKMV